jgi:hypothetical protein
MKWGFGWWQKYLDRKRLEAALRREIEPWLQASGEAYWRLEDKLDDPECRCCLIVPNKEACRCGCGCCPEERGG